ncbi:prepilin-type N-terminal cleavage/methylation domain-containing protein [Terrimicrobium sacchariphilum]|uniref:Prepilin-type N-terminal cleavage/methylation domain-containing protein n=1 Tax=Terrimicrobium sacchariphilum TaxID=690879 RepID=A0A146GBI4_TERSA|nr:prepilin-type N-terminal cleavage/methylation domain-containing protein [Terrimicrobium sacchariphilum]
MLNDPKQDDIAGHVRTHLRRVAVSGFTLVELLITIAIVGILTALVMVNWPQLRLMTQRSTALNNMRAIGVAFHLYANEHDGVLPQRTTGATDRWPRILADYLDDIKVYAAVGDGNVNRSDRELLLSNSRNNTSYIMNGYNDVGAYQDTTVQVRITQISHPSQVILLGTPKAGSTHFYMDMLEGKNGNHVDVLNLELYDNGSNYLFADGSARFIKKADYDHRLWLVNPDFAIPGEPSQTP